MISTPPDSYRCAHNKSAGEWCYDCAHHVVDTSKPHAVCGGCDSPIPPGQEWSCGTCSRMEVYCSECVTATNGGATVSAACCVDTAFIVGVAS